MSKVIFITGASRGFGKIWAKALLERGDRVAATSRNIDGLKDLANAYGEAFLPLEVDVTSKAESFAAIEKAKTHFGTLDVVINNAGYGVLGAIEEISEQEARDIVNVNLFGTLWTTQAAIPVFREKGAGHIIQLSSVLGLNTLPTMGIYSATKYGVEGFSEALQLEVKDFGINVTLVEPNGFATDFAGSSAVESKANPVYDKVKADFRSGPGMGEDDFGVPEATIGAILQLIDSDNPPLHFFLGKIAYPWTQYNYSEKMKQWEEWKEVSALAHGK